MERSTEEIRKTCDMACTILRATNDGDGLAPEHLKLLEMAVNGVTNEAGQKELERLYIQVTEQGGYKRPFLHSVEDMTIDSRGYVYYKGHKVEHYHPPSSVYKAGQKAFVAELQQRCKELESRGIEINIKSVLNYPESLNDQIPITVATPPKQPERPAPPLTR